MFISNHRDSRSLKCGRKRKKILYNNWLRSGKKNPWPIFFCSKGHFYCPLEKVEIIGRNEVIRLIGRSIESSNFKGFRYLMGHFECLLI